MCLTVRNSCFKKYSLHPNSKTNELMFSFLDDFLTKTMQTIIEQCFWQKIFIFGSRKTWIVLPDFHSQKKKERKKQKNFSTLLLLLSNLTVYNKSLLFCTYASIPMHFKYHTIFTQKRNSFFPDNPPYFLKNHTEK